ncbi:MAG: PorT family protein [Roseivirga sp.]|nr:PorT family protein [Roseivirga sp.]
MKKLLTLLILFVSITGAYAQINFGPRVTLLQSRLSLKNEAAVVSEADPATGYQLGAFMRAKLFGLILQPELLYTQSKSGFNIEGVGSYKLELDKIDLPIMIGYELGPVRLQGGPVFSLVTESKREQPNGTVLFVRNEYSSTSVGYQGGVGIDLWKFAIDIKYERDLTNLGDNLDRGLQAKQRQNHFVFALGYKIL